MIQEPEEVEIVVQQQIAEGHRIQVAAEDVHDKAMVCFEGHLTVLMTELYTRMNNSRDIQLARCAVMIVDAADPPLKQAVLGIHANRAIREDQEAQVEMTQVRRPRPEA